MKTKKWKPKIEEIYYVPDIFGSSLYESNTWYDNLFNQWIFNKNLVCKTPKEAITLAKAMLKVAERRGK